MSIAVLIGVHDGLVIAADSASALTISVSPNVVTGIANVYDNANKIFNLYKGKPIGCVTFGTGSIGNSSIGTLLKDLRATLMDRKKAATLDPPFDPDNYTMEGVSKSLGTFLGIECQKQPPATQLNLNVGFLIGGYSTNGFLGETWNVEIKAGLVLPVKEMRPADQAGISWGGLSEVIQRIVLGYSPALFQALADVSQLQGEAQTTGPQLAAQLATQLTPLLTQKLQAALVFTPMPIQDVIDLARFLVHASIMYSRFLPGAQVIGGPIEIAAITKHEGFKWISRKHYYDQSLNQEPKHVIVDRPE
jgi:hypothetical protein